VAFSLVRYLGDKGGKVVIKDLLMNRTKIGDDMHFHDAHDVYHAIFDLHKEKLIDFDPPIPLSSMPPDTSMAILNEAGQKIYNDLPLKSNLKSEDTS
jgi:hypothetical protein